VASKLRIRISGRIRNQIQNILGQEPGAQVGSMDEKRGRKSRTTGRKSMLTLTPTCLRTYLLYMRNIFYSLLLRMLTRMHSSYLRELLPHILGYFSGVLGGGGTAT
jgi:hypothetical protein